MNVFSVHREEDGVKHISSVLFTVNTYTIDRNLILLAYPRAAYLDLIYKLNICWFKNPSPLVLNLADSPPSRNLF